MRPEFTWVESGLETLVRIFRDFHPLTLINTLADPSVELLADEPGAGQDGSLLLKANNKPVSYEVVLGADGLLTQVRYSTGPENRREVDYGKFFPAGKGVSPRLFVIRPDTTKRMFQLRLSAPQLNPNLSERDFRK
jgi:hypothetical protein